MMKYRSARAREKKNPRSKSVSTGYLEGIKEARQEKTWLTKEHPLMLPSDWKARWKSNISEGEKIIARLEPGTFNSDFVKGQIDFWKNQSKALNKNPRNGGSDSSVRSPTSTRSEVRSPTRTSTSTKADTRGNVTVTGGAGAGANTTVTLKRNPRRSFGKKGRKAAPRKAARVSGRYMIRGAVNGVYYFFNGRGFDSVGAHAAVYFSRGIAADASRAIKGMLPHKLKSLEVVPL